MDNLKKLSTAILNHSDAKERLERTSQKKKVNDTLANTTAILRDIRPASSSAPFLNLASPSSVPSPTWTVQRLFYTRTG